MKIVAAVLLVLCTSCLVQNPDSYVSTPRTMVEDPYPYDDFVYGDSFLDEDNDGESTEFDCNDENPFVWTGAEEVCNGVDDNCNGEVDERDVCH